MKASRFFGRDERQIENEMLETPALQLVHLGIMGALTSSKPARLSRLVVFEERPVLELAEGFAKLFLGVHDDGAIPGDGLFQRLA